MNHLDHYAAPEPNGNLADILIRRGGNNPMGFPIYRVVRSEYIFEKVGGEWHDWDDNLGMDDRGGLKADGSGGIAVSRFRPDRIFVGIREIPTYTHLDEDGWILERWFPAFYFGSPESWNAHVVKGTNLPALGPYPTDGRYLMLCGPFPQEPDVSFVIDYIAHWETRRESFPNDVEAYVKQQVDKAIRREEERGERAIRENTARVMDSVVSLTSNTLEAGRWRSKMWEKSGHTSHMGN